MVKFSAILTSFLFSITAFSKNLAIEISYAEFMNPQNESYLELYFALNSNSIDYVEEKEGVFKGGVEIIVQILKHTQFITGDKFRILSPAVADTTNIAQRFIHQQRFLLENGSYRLRIDIQDINEPEEIYHLDQQIKITLSSKKLAASDLIFLDSYKLSASKNTYSKSGYDLMPMVSSGTPFFTEAFENLSFYIEIYNLDKAIGKDTPYLLRYYIYDADKNLILNKYVSHSKKEANVIQPILTSFNIKDISTGNYLLKVEVSDKERNMLLTKERFFYRKNNLGRLPITENLEEVDVTGTFADHLGSFKSVYQYIQYLSPISTDAEIAYQKSLIEAQDLKNMKRYFYLFWLKKNETNPETEWNEYYREVKIVNHLYSSSIRKGYLTDRGRVFLTYGRPDQKEVRKFEPGLHPYEIWQFNQITSPYVIKQVNKIFVFAELHPSTNEYELINSNAIGELNNRRWRYILADGIHGNGRDIDQNDISLGDETGSRLNDNFIFNSVNSNR